MSSIMTNVSAMTALQSLQQSNRNLDMTQERISTGYRVAEAKDNAAYWSIATTMRSDNKALSTVQDALGLGASKVDTAYTGINGAKDLVDEIKAKLVAAREPGVDRSKIQTEIKEYQAQLINNAGSTSFSGENWLSMDSADPNYSTEREIVAAFTRAADGSVSVSTIKIDITATKLFDATAKDGILDVVRAGGTDSVSTLDISALTNSAADILILDELIQFVDDALQKITDGATHLGAAKKRVDLQKIFVSSMMDAIDRGIGALVDADMSKESTRLQALQVQQQLGIQSLSIANQNAQGVLALFRS